MVCLFACSVKCWTPYTCFFYLMKSSMLQLNKISKFFLSILSSTMFFKLFLKENILTFLVLGYLWCINIVQKQTFSLWWLLLFVCLSIVIKYWINVHIFSDLVVDSWLLVSNMGGRTNLLINHMDDVCFGRMHPIHIMSDMFRLGNNRDGFYFAKC